MRQLLKFCSALLLTFFLAACDSAEDRAEAHYQSALALLAEGDVDRAIVELRNVFPLVPNHREARHELARIILVEQGRPRPAFQQYLRLVEQYPDDVLARINLSEIAFSAADWEEMRRHGEALRELDPENPRVKVILAALDYQAAVEADDNSARDLVVQKVNSLKNDAPSSNRILLEITLDDHLRKQEMNEALAILDGLTAEYPDNERYLNQRLQVLLALGDETAVEQQLVDLVERFPDNVERKQTLMQFYLSRGNLDKAEAFLREEVAQAPEDDTAARVDLIRFLTELRGTEEAMAEIDAAIATHSNPLTFVMMGAALDFAAGNPDGAIADLETAIENNEPSSQLNDTKIGLARMLMFTGDEPRARNLVETVLAEDATHIGALKMNANWLILADDTTAAISALRTALDGNPDDAEALTLMSQAYARTGSTDLVRDFLSLAVEASGNAPDESVRYAQLLIGEERYLPAEDILLAAIRKAPENLNLLRTTALLYLEMDDIGRMQQVVETVQRIDTEPARQLAIQLEAARLSRSSGIEEALSFLENIAGSADSNVSSQVLLLRARLAAGDAESAIEIARRIAAEQPDEIGPSLVLAKTLEATGDPDAALKIYTDLTTKFPENVSVRVEIAALQVRKGDSVGARATIADALAQFPNDPRLMLATANYQELDGDIDGAIATYEELYALNTNNLVVANNLASMLATYRDDDESLARAWTVARRFSDSELPAIQDTYGWIAHRRGNSEEALPYLQSAAAALQNDPIVQFHLAEVLFALNQREEALKQYQISLELAGPEDARTQIATARSRIAEIEVGGNE